MVFMITTLAFIFVFPTFGSAMTGYSANVEPYVQDRTQNFLPFRTFEYVFFVIHDGSKVGLEDEYAVTVRPKDFSEFTL
jgi:hypothetical protein